MSTVSYERLLERRSAREIDLGCHISLKNGYIYFQISKAASSSVKYALQSLEVMGTGRRIRSVNNREMSPHIWPSQLPVNELNRILKSCSFKKIAFVRNPFTRLLSCYLHRVIAEPESASNRALARLTGGLAGPEISFNNFVRAICDQKPSEQESHWRLQSEEIFFNLIDDWDFIGKFETLHEDLQKCVKLIVGDKQIVNIRKSKDMSPMKTSAQSRLKQYYTPEISNLVVRKYREDFRNFGYSTNLAQGGLK